MRLKHILRTLVVVFFSGAVCSALSQTIDIEKPFNIAREGSFFVGGHDVVSNTLSTLPQVDPNGTVVVEQMYVQYQEPVRPKKASIVLIHGCCLTGAEWETTPDGRMGWSQYFVRKGFGTYVADQAARGRSALNAAAILAVRMGKAPPETLPTGFSLGREAGWALFRFGPHYPETYAGAQFPFEAQDEFWKQTVPDWAYSMSTPNPTVPALSQLAKRLGHAVLISHSQSGIYPFQTVEHNADGVAAIIAIEPAACPAANADPAPYVHIPILVLFGDFIAQSAVWSSRLASCQAFVHSVNQAGGHARVLETTELGMHGNTHMLMQDRNNLEIADVLSKWIDDNAR